MGCIQSLAMEAGVDLRKYKRPGSITSLDLEQCSAPVLCADPVVLCADPVVLCADPVLLCAGALRWCAQQYHTQFTDQLRSYFSFSFLSFFKSNRNGDGWTTSCH